MCNDDQELIQDIDFTTIFVNDHVNWNTTSSNPVITSQNKLILNPSQDDSEFSRFLGEISNAKNKLRLILDLELKRKQNGGDSVFKCEISLIHNASGTILDVFSIYTENINDSEVVAHNFDRIYDYEELAGGVTLKIKYLSGSGIEMRLEYLKAFNYSYCIEKVRTYFGFKNIFDAIQGASSFQFNLLEYKIDGVETLTEAFFLENQDVSTPEELLYAFADIDGLPRFEESENNNSWNPFVQQLGLFFDTSAGYHFGKALGTTSGSDYGQGILNVGVEKPVVLNSNLDKLFGAFFFDIDYSKDLRIVFDIIISKGLSSTVFRQYVAEYNANTCEKEFYYLDRLRNDQEFDVNANGFLSGLTGEERPVEQIDCEQGLQRTERAGTSQFLINYGNSLGQAGIDYQADSIPNKFDLIYDGQTISSGWVGSNQYDQELLNAGVPPEDINTGNPSTGTGQLLFNKVSGTPATALIRVSSFRDGNFWRVDGICPDPTAGGGGNIRAIEIGVAECGEQPLTTQTVFVNTGGVDPNFYELQDGDMLFEDLQGLIIFNGNNSTYRKKIDTGGSLIAFQQYQFDVNGLGVVLNKTVCQSTGGGTDFIILNEQDCFTQGEITVEVPTGELRQVDITRSDNFGSPPVSELITATKTYLMTIEGDNSGGNLLFNSSMNIIAVNPTNNQTVISDSFNRQHNGNIC